jgi:hypothetical protein
MRKWIYNNSLSLTFLVLFIVSIIGQAMVGVRAYNHGLSEHHRSPITQRQYLKTGNFLDAVFSNWQAAILQLGCLITFGTILHQKGAPHSRKPEGDSSEKVRQQGGNASWLYRNSLSLAFLTLFVAAIIAHMIFGNWAYNETSEIMGDAPTSIVHYLQTADFWFRTLQTWQAEFVAIAIYVVLSIYLRQAGSPESKPVASSDDESGEANK